MKNIGILKVLGVIVLVTVIAIAFLPGCAEEAPTTVSETSQPAPAPKTYHWRFGTNTPDLSDPINAVAMGFVDSVGQLSNGRVDIELYPGGILGDSDWMQEAVAKDVLEFYMGYVATTLSERLDIFNVPGIGWTWEDITAVYASPEMLDVFQRVGEEVGWKVLGVTPVCFNAVFSKVPLTPIPEEVKKKSLKTRTMMMKSDEITLSALGFIATPMPFHEAVTALETGTIDAISGPSWFNAPNFEGMNLYGYDYHYRIEVQPLITSLKLWNNLSKNDQEMLQKAATSSLVQSSERAKATHDEFKGRAVSEFKFKEVIDLTVEQHIINTKAIREIVWPQLEQQLGKELLDMVRNTAVPLP